MRVRIWLTTAASALALAQGCETDGTPSGPAPVVADGGPVRPGTGGMDGGPTMPRTGRGTCAQPIDLGMEGRREGMSVLFSGDTAMAPNELHPTCTAPGADAGELVLRWRVPEGVPAVRVSTSSPETRFNTVLYVRDVCGQGSGDAGPAERTCNDDDHVGAPRSTVYLTELMAGQEFFFVVDGVRADPPEMGMAPPDRGAFVLSVAPVVLGAMGQPCRPDLDAEDDAGAPPPRCDAPLRCSEGGAADGTALCVPALPIGTNCDPRGFQNTCGAGSTCAVDPSPPEMSPPPRCAAAGTLPGARCRANEPRCDGDGVTCGAGDEPLCVRILPARADCDPGGHANRCAAGLRCVTDDAGAATCR